MLIHKGALLQSQEKLWPYIDKAEHAGNSLDQYLRGRKGILVYTGMLKCYYILIL